MIPVTEVLIYPFEPGSLQPGLKAYAEIVLAGCLRIRGVRIFEQANGGIFIRYPSVALREGEFRDVVVPDTPEIKKYLRDAVVAAYRKETG